MPTASNILNSDNNMNELENEFSPVASHKTTDAVQVDCNLFFFFLDCNLLRDLVAMAFRLNVPGFLIHGDSLVAQMVESACNAGDLSSVPESGRSPGEGNGNPLQYSCLENPIARGAW